MKHWVRLWLLLMVKLSCSFSYNDCIFTQAECVLHSNFTPFNLHLSSINFDTHIHSWSLYNIAPVSYSLYPLFSLNKNISLFWRRMNLENCQKYINLPYNIQNILNVSGNNHTKCQIAFYKKWCNNVTLVYILATYLSISWLTY